MADKSRRKYHNARYQKCKEEGICTKCQVRPVPRDRTGKPKQGTCDKCRGAILDRQRELRGVMAPRLNQRFRRPCEEGIADWKVIAQMRTRDNLCQRCGQEPPRVSSSGQKFKWGAKCQAAQRADQAAPPVQALRPRPTYKAVTQETFRVTPYAEALLASEKFRALANKAQERADEQERARAERRAA